MRLAFIRVVLAITGLLAVPHAAACESSGIALDQLKVRPTDESFKYLEFVGRIVNNCTVATGVQLKLVLFDKTGNIVKVHDVWPASFNNIPAHSDFPFELTLSGAPFRNFEVRVTEVKTWRH